MPSIKPYPLEGDRWEVGKDSRAKSVILGVIHYDGATTTSGGLSYLKSVSKNPEVSASYNAYVGDGQSYMLLDPTKYRSWHAGRSSITIEGREHKNVNGYSVGVAVRNKGYKTKRTDLCTVRAPLPGTGDMVWWEPYNDEDIIELASLCLKIERKIGRKIPWVGHQDVSRHRKFDPGPLFPWGLFYQTMGGAKPSVEETSHVAALKYLESAEKEVTGNDAASSIIRSKIEDAKAWVVYSTVR